jgi:nucleotidyltransferase/DNA polymerase involved in DNA repair
MIASIRLPYFAAEIACQEHADWSGKPLALYDPQYGVEVYAVSELAAGTGVRVGMSVWEALAVCPDVHLAQVSRASHTHALDDLMEALAPLSSHTPPRIQRENTPRPYKGQGRKPRNHLTPGLTDNSAMVYVDVGRVRDGQAAELASHITAAIHMAMNLTPAISLASGRFPAWAASLSLKPGEVLHIPCGDEAATLAPYPVTLLPVDREAIRHLHLLGLKMLGEVARIALSDLLSYFGGEGKLIHQLAQGIDKTPILPFTPKVTERISRQFEPAVSDRQVLEASLKALAEELIGRLSDKDRVARDITLRLYLEDGHSLERGITPRHQVSNHRSLARILGELLTSMPVSARISEVEVILAGIAPVTLNQLSLFERQPLENERLREVLLTLTARYGDDRFFWASIVDPNARLPERRYRLRETTAA